MRCEKITLIIALVLMFFGEANSQTGGCITPIATPNLFCDGGNATPTSVAFDFNNAGQTSFTYSYTIDGGAPITGTHIAPSNFKIFGLSPGQTVVFTLTWVGLCGDPEIERTCTVPCVTTTAPNFATIAPICSGTPAPILANTAPNGVTGTWSPATVSNTTSGVYLFTPTSACSPTQTLNVNVIPTVTPTFNPIAPICRNSPAPVLPQNSTNVPPVTGTWSPPVNTSVAGTTIHTFTPNPGQCPTSGTITMPITVLPNKTPDFPQIADFCSGATAPTLSTVSPSGVSGTWSPSTVSNTSSGTYTFTAAPGQCSTNQTMQINVTPSPTPVFPAIPPICEGFAAPVLPMVSDDGVVGVWSPAAIDNTQSDTYTFYPNPGQCASEVVKFVQIIPSEDPGFESIAFCAGTPAPVLSTQSPTGINGIWAPSVIDPLQSGSYVFTPNEGVCANPQTIQVTVNQDSLTEVNYAVTEPFTENQVITVLATAAGNYLYQLDNGPIQQSNVFENVSAGIHSVTVYDANGCSDKLSRGDILILNYPHYFTPNADGYNDRWRIDGLTKDATIYIFDRYGKLLKQLAPDSEGWDGTFTGVPMPSSDYWFKLHYYDNAQLKVFNAHFSLKR